MSRPTKEKDSSLLVDSERGFLTIHPDYINGTHVITMGGSMFYCHTMSIMPSELSKMLNALKIYGEGR